MLFGCQTLARRSNTVSGCKARTLLVSDKSSTCCAVLPHLTASYDALLHIEHIPMGQDSYMPLLQSDGILKSTSRRSLMQAVRRGPTPPLDFSYTSSFRPLHPIAASLSVLHDYP